MSKTRDIVDLIARGFRPYSGQVPEGYYREIGCLSVKKAEWFCRPWSEEHKHARYICLGCTKRCAAVDPAGWQLLLPLSQTRPMSVVFAPMTPVSVDELLRFKRVLRVDEAAWALNVSRSTVMNMIDEGVLEPVPGTPIRVTVDSVRRNLEPL